MADNILLVDDDPDIAQTLKSYLEQSGYQVSVARDGLQAVQAFRRDRPDLIVLDLMMPEMDGLEVTRTIRRDSEVPIIMLTARVEETDKLIGLELGADDYVTKPFSPREIVARVKAVLRRTRGQPSQPDVLTAGAIRLDRTAHEAKLNNEQVDLTPSEFNLLQALMDNPGRVLTRLQLIEIGFGYTYEGYERTVDAHIKNLRQKIEADPRNPEYILTVYGVGYRFNAPHDGE